MAKKTLSEQQFQIQGMHCTSCAATISRKVGKLEGVERCEVNFATEQAKVTFDLNKVTLHQMNQQIEKLGYSLHSVQSAPSDEVSHPMHMDPNMPDMTPEEHLAMKGGDHSQH